MSRYKPGDVLIETHKSSANNYRPRDVIVIVVEMPARYAHYEWSHKCLWAYYRDPGSAEWRGPWHDGHEGEHVDDDYAPHPDADRVWADYCAWVLTDA